jgi:hypothetical protein
VLFKKLQLKSVGPALLFAEPAAFAVHSSLLGDRIERSLDRIDACVFALAFARSRVDVVSIAQQLAARWHQDDPFWIAYPKQSSKRYQADFNRDNGFAAMGEVGFEAVRQVAIDDDWSALRFRRVAFIGAMRRDPQRALTEEGRRRTRS